MTSSPRPIDTALYAAVKREARKRFERWPSAYGSAWLVKEYTHRGGRYAGDASSGVDKWMREKWIQVGPALDTGARVPCGGRGPRKGRACRPSVRVDARTPPTLDEIVTRHGVAKVRSLARRKSRHMDGRVDWMRGKISGAKTKR